jgi:hypothetical protein
MQRTKTNWNSIGRLKMKARTRSFQGANHTDGAERNLFRPFSPVQSQCALAWDDKTSHTLPSDWQSEQWHWTLRSICRTFSPSCSHTYLLHLPVLSASDYEEEVPAARAARMQLFVWSVAGNIYLFKPVGSEVLTLTVGGMIWLSVQGPRPSISRVSSWISLTCTMTF